MKYSLESILQDIRNWIKCLFFSNTYVLFNERITSVNCKILMCLITDCRMTNKRNMLYEFTSLQ